MSLRISWPKRPVPRDRPFVWINAAISLDGKLAFPGGKRAILSSPADFQRVDLLRASADAILVGAGTVRNDDPSLRVHWERLRGMSLSPAIERRKGDPPIRVVLGSSRGLPARARVLDGSIPTVVFGPPRGNRPRPGVTWVSTNHPRVNLRVALRWLLTNGIHRLMVEGGSETIASFLGAGCVDRLTLYVAPVLIGGKDAPGLIGGRGYRSPSELVRLRVVRATILEGGLLVTYEPR